MSSPPLISRPTKYRAWTGSELVTVQSLCFNDKGCLWYGNGTHMGWAFLWPNAVWTADDPKPSEGDLKPVMEWTGLTDPNGLAIYEGDIVKLSDEFLRQPHGHHMNGFGHVWRHEGGEFICSYNHEHSECSDPLWHLPEGAATVVGNVCQTPDLMNV